MRLIVAIVLTLGAAFSQEVVDRKITAHIDGDWIVAQQGSDETLQSIRVAVWGSWKERLQARFEQLDNDPEQEYVVISRNGGTGPYYQLQIIDFRPSGILIWAYESMGVPEILDGKIMLGMRQEYQGARTVPIYREYRYKSSQLVSAED